MAKNKGPARYAGPDFQSPQNVYASGWISGTSSVPQSSPMQTTFFFSADMEADCLRVGRNTVSIQDVLDRCSVFGTHDAVGVLCAEVENRTEDTDVE